MMLTLEKCKIIIEEYTEDKDEYANFCKANFIDVNDTTTKVSKKRFRTMARFRPWRWRPAIRLVKIALFEVDYLILLVSILTSTSDILFKHLSIKKFKCLIYTQLQYNFYICHFEQRFYHKQFYNCLNWFQKFGWFHLKNIL